jgi:hypothetical protein
MRFVGQRIRPAEIVPVINMKHEWYEITPEAFFPRQIIPGSRCESRRASADPSDLPRAMTRD